MLGSSRRVPFSVSMSIKDLPQTRVFHKVTLHGVLGVVPQLVISAIIGNCVQDSF